MKPLAVIVNTQTPKSCGFALCTAREGRTHDGGGKARMDLGTWGPAADRAPPAKAASGAGQAEGALPID
ncbi:MAG: hypothetical protein ACK56I_02975, partial [bacterium]